MNVQNRGRLGAWLLAHIVIATSCGAPVGPSVSDPPWEKALAETTCTDWLAAMDASQRIEMAAHLLDRLSRDRPPSISIPVSAFEESITEYCGQPRDNLVAGLGEAANLVQVGAGFVYADLTDEPGAS